MVRVHNFRLGDKVCSAAAYADVVSAFGKEEIFWWYFGGGMTFGTPSSPDYLGVWGARNSSRLRRMLRGLYGPLDVVEMSPPLTGSSQSVTGARLNRQERQILEETILRARSAEAPG
ncbi:hypothetical protein [Devosia sp. Leaf420]|uniref:hypothetical protein n=1 Tax=Devosia sp. Leaf420 TaxID=1736374 RepID=UPI0012E91F19|nr:hypothetical protein [Devosia sp. Leaf420]